MRSEKQLLLDEVNELIDCSCAIIIARYNRLTPQNSWDLSKELSKSKSNFRVIKKRILYKAAEDKDLFFKSQKFDGHIGIIFIEGDPLDATKAIVKFQKDNEALEILAGQIEGKSCSKEEIIILSKLPTKDEIRAQLLGLFESPMAESLAVIESLLLSVLYCLENKES